MSTKQRKILGGSNRSQFEVNPDLLSWITSQEGKDAFELFYESQKNETIEDGRLLRPTDIHGPITI